MIRTTHAPAAVRRLCRHRASKRWSALLTQAKSRIGHHFGMRERLGKHWEAFVRYAQTYHKAAFLDALVPGGELRCAGKLGGAPCPHGACLALSDAAEVARRLETFHMDHTHDAAHICQVWSDALPPHPTSWDDGVCGPLVAQLLFGVHDHPMADADPNPLWRAQLIIRCGNRKGVGQRASQFCHDVAHAHYAHTLTVADLRTARSVEVSETADEEGNSRDR